MPEEQISMRKKVAVKMADNPAFGNTIEVDKDVAAQGNVHIFHERHTRRIGQVHLLEIYIGFDFSSNVQFAVARQKIFLLERFRNIARTVSPVMAKLGMGERAFIQVGGQDFERPILQMSFLFFQQGHAEGVGLLAGGASSAPYPKMARRRFRASGGDFRQNNVAYGVELRE